MRRYSTISTMIAAGLLVAACEAPKDLPASYQEAHPIVVSEETVLAGFSVPSEAGRVAAPERNEFGRFVRTFQLRAKGAIVLHVDADKGDGTDRSIIVQRITTALDRAGVDPTSIQVMPGTLGHEGDAPVMAAFQAYKVIPPECGDWSGRSGYNWANVRLADYGCSYQRNLARTIANPADLLDKRAMPMFDPTRNIVRGEEAGEGAGGEGSEAGGEAE